MGTTVKLADSEGFKRGSREKQTNRQYLTQNETVSQITKHMKKSNTEKERKFILWNNLAKTLNVLDHQ